MSETTMPDLRHQRAEALIPTVRKVDGGYRVASSSRDTTYLVTKPNGRIICTCPDFQHHADEPDFQCKHILAVLGARGNGHSISNPMPQALALQSFSEGGPPDSLHIVHQHLANEDPVRVKLIKNTKGYSWEISVAEPDPNTALATLRDIEERIRTEYGEPSEPSS
jgi:hypothetical protein